MLARTNSLGLGYQGAGYPGVSEHHQQMPQLISRLIISN